MQLAEEQKHLMEMAEEPSRDNGMSVALRHKNIIKVAIRRHLTAVENEKFAV